MNALYLLTPSFSRRPSHPPSTAVAPRRAVLGIVSALALASILAPRTAAANGRYPAAGQIALNPKDPANIVVRATYGILTTSDAAASWGWICEAAVGYGGIEDPMMGITADGSLLAGIFKGLGTSRDGGCSWEFAGGALADRYVTDLSVERADPSRAVLIVSNGVGDGKFLTQLWESADSGVTWAQAGVDMPEEFLGLTVDVAPSDPKRVYVSGRYGAPLYPGVLQRSNDRGATWEKLDILGSDDTHLPYLGAIDPKNPDILYVRLDGDPVDSLLVSIDGGGTWKTVFEGTGNLLGFALSPDGSTVWIGGVKDGLWRAPTDKLTSGMGSDMAFEKVSDLAVRCLTATETELYACADEFADGFTAGLSTTAGSTFTPILHLAGLCGPLTCGAETSVGKTCADAWGPVQLTIGAKPCDAAGSTSSGGQSGPEGAEPGDSSSGGCGCRAAPAAGASAATGAAVTGLLLAWRRARRRRA